MGVGPVPLPLSGAPSASCRALAEAMGALLGFRELSNILISCDGRLGQSFSKPLAKRDWLSPRSFFHINTVPGVIPEAQKSSAPRPPGHTAMTTGLYGLARGLQGEVATRSLCGIKYAH